MDISLEQILMHLVHYNNGGCNFRSRREVVLESLESGVLKRCSFPKHTLPDKGLLWLVP